MLLDELESEPKATVAWLETVYRRESGHRNFVRDIAEAVASGAPALERGGARLMRRWVDEKGQIPSTDWEVVLNGLAGMRSWVARLELCRLLSEHPDLFDAAPEITAEFSRVCAADHKPFVRAWGMTAFYALGQRQIAYRAEAKRCLLKARKDPAKSVQARARRLT